MVQAFVEREVKARETKERAGLGLEARADELSKKRSRRVRIHQKKETRRGLPSPADPPS